MFNKIKTIIQKEKEETINVKDFYKLKKGEPAYKDGFYISIQNTDDRVYYLTLEDYYFMFKDFIHQSDVKMKVKYKVKKVGLNKNARVITELLSMSGEVY